MGKSNQEKNMEIQPSALSSVSLSQVLLAPLDAIFKAQIHAARSFLNMLLQIGFPHKPVGEDGYPIEDDGQHYNQEFCYETEIDGQRKTCKVSIPSLALVPVAPLAVESATFKLEMRVESVAEHNQIQESEKKTVDKEQGNYGNSKRPWFLVQKPISIRGNIAPSNPNGEHRTDNKATIQIEVNVNKTSMPSGLDKLLTFLTQTGFTAEKNDKP